MTLNLVDATGSKLSVGAKLGSGGEGAVFELHQRPNMVAKIFHRPPTSEFVHKLEAMSRMANPTLQALTAWPTGLIFDNRRSAVGLLMPKASGFKDIHKLYSPKSRKQEFSSANFAFLVHVAANVARAFATVHNAGVVIGDVNHGGVTVAGNGIVKLIDCDSFQINANGKYFLCGVGVPTFTAPELQGKSLSGIVRSANHDNFGLAVLIFHLLFMGRHPFAGRYLGKGDMPIETAIQQLRFAYGSGRRQLLMEPPPNVPALPSMTPAIAALFEQAFAPNGASSRPLPTEWATRLERLRDGLKICGANTSHCFPQNTGDCPWCSIEASSGVVLFNIHIPQARPGAAFDLAAVWSAIESIRLVPPATSLATTARYAPPKPSQAALQAVGASRASQLQGVAARGGIIVGVIALIAFLPGAWWIWIGVGLWAWANVPDFDNGHRSRFDTAVNVAAARVTTAEQRLQRIQRTQIGAGAEFEIRKRQLQQKREIILNLPQRRSQGLIELERQRLRHQLERFLSNFYIEHAQINGIGPGRKSVLESYGIETAADIIKEDILEVPGFGMAMARKLLDWRKDIERKFKFSSNTPVDPQQIVMLDQRLEGERRAAESALLAGAAELMQLKQQSTVQLSEAYRDLENARQQLAQAKVDRLALGG